MTTQKMHKYFLLIILSVLVVFCTPKEEKSPYPLGSEIQTLSNDLESVEYKDVVKTMIYQDLREEWKRVATPDNYLVFSKKHGGIEKIVADSTLNTAYKEREQIANNFIAFMEEAFRKINKKPSFTSTEVEQILLAEVARTEAMETLEDISIEPVIPASGAEKQWPCFRGPSGQGIANLNKIPLNWSQTENIVWKVKLSGKGNSSPVIWDNRIFITSATKDGKTRELYCYNRSNGDLLWKNKAPVPEKVEKLYWKNSYASSTPVTDGERVITFLGNSGIVCVNMDGKLQWARNLGDFTTTHGPGTNPILYKDKVILIQDQNNAESVFIALNKYTGEIVWTKKRESAMGWSSPIIVRVKDHDELVYNGSYNVKGYNPDTGSEIWTLNGSTKEAVPIIVSGGGLFYSVSGRNGAIMAIRPGGKGDITNTHLFWRNERGGPHVPSPAYYKERLYIVNDTGIATCINAFTGKTVWRERLKGRFSMSPIIVDDKIIVTNEKGLTTILKAGDTFDIVSQNDLLEETLSTPAILDERIYIRTATHLYCIGE